MKNFSFLGMALLASTFVNAQSSLQVETKQKLQKVNRLGVPTQVNQSVNRGAPIFYEDFANGLTGNSGFGAWTTSGADANIWMHDFDGPNGDLSDPSLIIDSETAANGFMMFDANLSNPGAGGGAPVVNRSGSLISPIIDLSGETGVTLSFEQAYAYCCSAAHQLNIEVSIDGGATYPNVFQINEGVEANVDTRGIYTVNLSSVAAGQDEVVLKFTWGAGTASHYYWQLDDITLDTPPENDLEMISVWTAQVFEESTVVGYEYRQTPIGLAESRELTGMIRNNGSISKDVYMEVTISSNSGDVTLDNSEVPMTLAPNETGTLNITFDPAVWEVSNYSVSYTARAVGVELADDFTPMNNTLTKDFDITNNTWAPHQRNYGGNSLFGNFIDVDDDGIRDITPVSFYNEFLVFEDITAYAIGMAFADAGVADTEVGAAVTWGIYPLDGSGDDIDRNNPLVEGQNLEVIDNSPVNVGLYDSDINTERTVKNFNKLEFDSGSGEFTVVNTSAILTGDVLGISYFAGVNLPADAIVFIRINNDDNDDNTSLGYGDLGSSGVALYTMPSHNIIELYTHENATALNEQANDRPSFYLSNNRPNPFNGETKVTYQLNKGANNVVFEVFDITGKQVLVENMGNQSAGQYNIILDGANFTSGLYYYSLTVNGERLSRKMVITE